MNKFLVKCILPELTQKEIENMNRPLTTKNNKLLI